MGLFSSSSKSKEWLEMPDWMEGNPQAIADSAMGLLDPSMTPEERIAGLSDAERQAITQAIAMGGSTEGMDFMMNSGMGAMDSGYGYMTDAIGMGPIQNQGPDMNMVANIASNPYMDQMINAATRDDRRNLEENQLTGSAMAQAMSGNTISTRGAIGDAVLERGYQDRRADVAADLQGNAYNMGVGVASNVASQNAGLMSDYQHFMGNMGQNMWTGGANMYNMGQNIGLQNIQTLMQAGGLERSIEQARNDFAYNDPFYRTGFASGIINPMAQQYGTHHSKTKSSPSIVGMGLSAMGSMMQMPSFNFGGGGSQGYDPSGLVDPSWGLPRV